MRSVMNPCSFGLRNTWYGSGLNRSKISGFMESTWLMACSRLSWRLGADATHPFSLSHTRGASSSVRVGVTFLASRPSPTAIHSYSTPSCGGCSSAITRTSSAGSVLPSSSLLSWCKRYSLLFPGTVTLTTSSDSLMRGLPLISTSLYTQPRAGCFWHVAKWVPMPKISISCFCSFSSWRVCSLMSLLAATLNLRNSGILSVSAIFLKRALQPLESWARSPESRRTP
mmetsp:Transcript_19720/g.28504  ORF Transcript_19720/g.28504 Transcript_19720/m.28504 type:complete len:227 (-) Transcript_19720:1007-1687(-)